MDNFDKKVQETLKQVAEGVNPSPQVEQRIHDEILSRCPELRKQIAILFGGCSPEYSVSLQSAYSVITHIDRKNIHTCFDRNIKCRGLVQICRGN